MLDFLSFRTFITPSLLLAAYYFGAVVMPLAGWGMAQWLKRRYRIYFTSSKRYYFYALATVCFLCMEMLWRVMFEFMIAYFDMHDALMKMSAVS